MTTINDLASHNTMNDNTDNVHKRLKRQQRHELVMYITTKTMIMASVIDIIYQHMTIYSYVRHLYSCVL